MNRQYDCIDRTPRKTSRREMLKLGVAAAAGTALAGVSVPWVHAAEENTIRLALIGCGGRGSGAVSDAFSAAGARPTLRHGRPAGRTRGPCA